MERRETETAILDAAQELVQMRGYNAFSYRDLSERVGVRTATIHYYFPTKGDLGRSLLQRFIRDVEAALASLDAKTKDPRRKLEGYVRLFQDTIEAGGRMCLGGMLATESPTLPEAVREEVRRFVGVHEA